MLQHSIKYLCIAAALLCCGLCVTARPETKPKKPTPEGLIGESAAHNGLAGATTQWHVVARFESFDPDGKPKDSGTFEEWWFGPKSYKSVYKSTTLNQTDVATEQGLFRSGDQRWLTSDEYAPERLVLSPVSSTMDPHRFQLEEEDKEYGGTKLRCVLLAVQHPLSQPLRVPASHDGLDFTIAPSYCMAPDSAAVRYESSGPSQAITIFNNVSELAGQFVARHIQQAQSGKLAMDVQIVQLEAIPASATAPAPEDGSQGPLHGPVELPTGRMAVLRGQGDFDDIVAHAIPPNTTTEVDLKISIDTSGHVTNVALLSGPKEFAGVVAKAVRKYAFAPFVVAGTAVEVNLTQVYKFNSQTTYGGLIAVP